MILITGENDYLGKAFQDYYKYYHGFKAKYITLESYILNPVPEKLTKIIHFAGVADKNDFKNKSKMIDSMIILTQQLIDIAEQYNIEFIFASSVAAEKQLDRYGTYKRAMEYYIKDTLHKYKIFRIPRVYSSCRNKGFIKFLKDGEVPLEDYDIEIEFLDLDKFLPQIYNYIFREDYKNISRIFYFDKLETKTIQEIKERYLNN